jgi:hypothetical protein
MSRDATAKLFIQLMHTNKKEVFALILQLPVQGSQMEKKMKISRVGIALSF